ncbi:MAG: hypothetical protein F8N36_07100 [Desulfovibrio sp.]|uniref:hypothetical protein n=1 Tax=Desulfovibrio sp. TaxID=885 RepID=UPI00135EF010|nr:hypothetical protein [Desulfovibrio sp.]MTJ92618.1 hypothetical protein [Desulfovibrio sp.]
MAATVVAAGRLIVWQITTIMSKSTTVTTTLLWGLIALVILQNTAQALPQEFADNAITQEQAVIAQHLYAAHNQNIYSIEQKLAELRSELNNQDATSGANLSTVRNIYKEMAEAKTQLFTINDEFNSALVKNGINPATFAHHDGSVLENNCW